jgi:hypothetical protein
MKRNARHQVRRSMTSGNRRIVNLECTEEIIYFQHFKRSDGVIAKQSRELSV